MPRQSYTGKRSGTKHLLTGAVIIGALMHACDEPVASAGTSVAAEPDTSKHIARYSSVVQVVHDERPWADRTEGYSSCVLHFNMYSPDTVSIELTPECWAMFPVEVKRDSIVLYWRPVIDTKYEFGVVRTMRSMGAPVVGRPFMQLALSNDSTLTATYIEQTLIDSLNISERERTLFPKSFHVMHREQR